LYISCTYHNVAEIVFIAKKKGFKLNNIITWYKTNAMPNITKRTFTHATEYVCWFVKGNNWKFNYEKLKEINPHRTKDGKPKQVRDFIDFIELPIVQGKERIKSGNGRAVHPTQKPEKLIELIISASSNENDLVLDPFLGTGTTGIVASKLNRKWIGIEINEEYVKVASKRIFGNKVVKYV
jgi:site-specific DNA-methyltransferase (adenine-specific)/modification methylase